jgi:cytoskeletal protein RodZ
MPWWIDIAIIVGLLLWCVFFVWALFYKKPKSEPRSGNASSNNDPMERLYTKILEMKIKKMENNEDEPIESYYNTVGQLSMLTICQSDAKWSTTHMVLIGLGALLFLFLSNLWKQYQEGKEASSSSSSSSSSIVNETNERNNTYDTTTTTNTNTTYQNDHFYETDYSFATPLMYNHPHHHRDTANDYGKYPPFSQPVQYGYDDYNNNYYYNVNPYPSFDAYTS